MLLFFLLFTMGIASFGKTWIITNSGFTFSPSTLTITVGDSVNFNINSIHIVQEVSQSTCHIYPYFSAIALLHVYNPYS